MKKIIILSSALLLISFSANAQISVVFGEPEQYPPRIYSPYYEEYIYRYPTGHNRRDADWIYWGKERRDQEERNRKEHDGHDNGNHGEGNRGNDNHDRR